MTDGAPVADLRETEEFLTRLPLDVSEHLAVIMEGKGPIVRSVRQAGLQDGLRWLAKFQGTHNCYFHPNPLREGVEGRKARREDVADARMLHVDIDDLAALPRIGNFPLKPSVVIMSGGGYQCLWFLREPVADLARIEVLNRLIADLLGGDSCHSIDHLMRLPGTLNVPNAKKRGNGRIIVRAEIVRELTDFKRVVGVDEAERVLRGGGLPSAPVATAAHAGSVVLLTAETLPVAVDDFTLALIRDGDHLDHPIGSPKAAYRSRSEVVFRVACDILKAGGDEGMVVGVLMNPENGVSASILEKPRPELVASRQAQRAAQATSEGWAVVGKNGMPTPCFANALRAVPRLGLRLEYDEFHNRQRVDGYPVQALVGEVSDDICATIRREVLTRFGVDLGKENVRDAIHTLCIENTYHPIREYLDGLKWDGKPRIGEWLVRYLGAEDSPLNLAIGVLVLVAAVRRVRTPGAKFDAILVLEGSQGTGKSTAISILAGEENFSDQEILTLDTKAQMEALEGVWFYELGELQGLGKADIDKVKAFASRGKDRARPAYGHHRVDRPRQTIFVGTTNDEQYLRDPTGNRRFWPVRTGRIDLAGLIADRDQLFAEAAHLEAQGMSLVLPEGLWGMAASAQDSRLLDDPWLDLLQSVPGQVEGGVERISSTQLLTRLEMVAERQNPSSAKRLVSLMRKLGWTGPKLLRIGGKVLRGYERKTDGPDTPEKPDY